VAESSEAIASTTGTSREAAYTLSPGARGGWNLGSHQMILGLAVPVTWTAGVRESALFGYLSYELPFGQ
jgi:hypothetical protein